MNASTDQGVVRKSVRVSASVERAFSVFVEQMETWWPASHHIGKNPFQTIVVEPRVGGRWYEQDSAGERCEWGTVLQWDPPRRVVFSWHLGPGHDRPDWVFDPDMSRASEVEIRFIPDGSQTTTIELTHSKLERHGEGYEQLRALLEQPGAWQGILQLYAKAFESETAQAAKERQ